jgi:hypothetical protein
MIGTGLRADPEIKRSELIAIQYGPVCHTENLCVNQSRIRGTRSDLLEVQFQSRILPN